MSFNFKNPLPVLNLDFFCKAHKIVLAKYSKLFLSLFSSNMFSTEEDWLNPHIILPDVPEIIMEAIMDFIYSGVINQMIPKDMKDILFQASKYLEITCLSSLLCDYTERQKELKAKYEKKLAAEAEEDKKHEEFLKKFFSDDTIENSNSDIDTNNNWQIARPMSSDSEGWNTTKLNALVYVANRYDLRDGFSKTY